MKNAEFVAVVIALTAVAFYAGFQANAATAKQTAEHAVVEAFVSPMQTASPQPVFEQEQGQTRLIAIHIPAVDKFDNGVLTTLNVEARRGTGRVYIDYSQGAPLLGSETQNSILTAVEVAKKITGKQLKNTNLYFSISTEAQEVGGSSAGASAAIATAALLSERKLKNGFIMTGTVSEEGRIGKVGRILEKARAAKEGGYATFLVPPGESKTLVAFEKCQERFIGGAFVRTCNAAFEERSVEELVGIKIIEVADIQQAFELTTEKSE